MGVCCFEDNNNIKRVIRASLLLEVLEVIDGVFIRRNECGCSNGRGDDAAAQAVVAT